MAINANTQIYDNILHRAAMIRLYERRVNGKVELILNGHAVKIDKLIRDAEKSEKGFVKLREAIDQDIQRTFKDVHLLSKRSLEDLAKDQMTYTHGTLDKSYGHIWDIERPPATIAEDIILKQPLHKNKTLEQGWKGIGLAEKKRLEAIIRKGIADGSTVNAIADAVRKHSSINITKFQSRALVVTAVTSVTAQVDHEIYKANEKAITGWQYVAVLDSRTTPLCAHRDGTIYPVNDTIHLPPAHYYCRSTTIPVFKSWDDIAKLEGVAQVRRRNLSKLTKKQIAYYDGQTPLRESYNDWLNRQPTDVQLKHLGDYQKVELFRTGQVKLDKFTNPEGNTVGIRELRAMTDSGHILPNDTKRFAIAKEKLDAMQIWATTPDDFINDSKLRKTLLDYYMLQATELDGTLSLTNYRGTLIGVKKSVKSRVLTSPPRDDQVKFNPITGRYEDVRLYQPNTSVYANNLRLVEESDKLLPKDKEFIRQFVEDLDERMGVNERAVITDNLRIIFGRYRENKEMWTNFKAVTQGQIKFDVMNVSDAIETQIRKDSDVLKKLLDSNYIDPVLGPTQLQDIHDTFIDNIVSRNLWEDKTAPKIARELRSIFDYKIIEANPIVWARLDDSALQQFYLKFAHRLSLADMPDRDNFAVALGRDLYNLANLNGSRNQWYKLGMEVLEAKNAKKFFDIETYGVQKRRLKSRMSGKYFGPYYDTASFNIRVTDTRIQDYARLNRKIDLGLRVPFSNTRNKLVVREGYKTYWINKGSLGYEDTRIPITSTSSFGDFPEEFIDKNFVNALNWASDARYKVDEDYYDFIKKLLYFEDDKGKAKFYNERNEFRKYIASRGDSYERFKAMEWLRAESKEFSNQQFIDHRARIYERGLIGPQAGETFRPFLNTATAKNFSALDYRNFQDQIGSFLGGLNDRFEGRYNSLSFSGRRKIAEKWRTEMVRIGNHMLRGKPNDIRAILESDIVSMVDGEELAKFYRLAIESAKIDNFLNEQIGSFPVKGELFHISTKPLTNLDFKPRVPDNYLVKNGFEDSVTKRISFAENIDDALKAMSMNLKGKRLYVYRAPRNTKYIIPSVKQVPDVKITSERWVLEPTRVEPLGVIQVGKAIEKPFKYTYGDKTADLYGWEWNTLKTNTDPYSPINLQKLSRYKTALAMEQDASSSGAQIIALTTKNKQLAELSNVVPTNYKKRLYDEIAAATYNDPKFREINKKLGLSEKDLRKAAKAQNMVTFYGAGERTGALNVEGKLSKILEKETNVLVVKASDREKVLNEISARMARYEKWDPETYAELKALRENVKDIFNKGLSPGDDIMEQLYFLDPKTLDLVERMSSAYSKVVTPDDFKAIAAIMSEHLAEKTPILKDFTKFFGRLAEEYLSNAKPSKSDFDWQTIGKVTLLGNRKKGYVLPNRVSEILGIKVGEPISEKALKRFGFWKPDGTLSQIIYGVKNPNDRRTGAKYFKVSIAQVKDFYEFELFYANKLPKSWTNVPWVNFDGKILEQNFTQSFEERLTYRDQFGNWTTNILQVPQKTEATWWEQVINKSGKINDIADTTKARTAYAVNGNHSNDATLVKNFHLWGRNNKVETATIHDAFFTNITDMLAGRKALKELYAKSLKANVIEAVLDEMLARGLPKRIYDQYMEEAISKGLIPIPGKSKIGDRVLTESDILKIEDVLQDVNENFEDDYGWYGVG